MQVQSVESERNSPKVLEEAKVGELNGREVVVVPSSHSDDNKNSSIGGALCCCLASGLVIAGGTMWGVCSDVTRDGCNEAIKISGQALAGVGMGIIGLNICCTVAIVCCGVGVAILGSK